MKYKVLFSYDMMNEREETELYDKELETGESWNKLEVGKRLYMFGNMVSKGTANVTSIKDLTEDIKVVKTRRSIHIIKIDAEN